MQILLHICCGPCSIYPVLYLKELNIPFKGFFFNPNIHPFTEFEKRTDALINLRENLDFDLIWDGNIYDINNWFYEISDKYEKPERCSVCYGMRVEKTAVMSKNLGINYFSTTLLYSKYQNHQKIREISEGIAKKYQLNFFYHDFRMGWEIGIEKSKELNIYRQKYCGCIFSERERYEKKIKKLSERLYKKENG